MIDPIDPATVSKGTPLPTATEIALIVKVNEVVAVVNAINPNKPSSIPGQQKA